MRKTIVCIEPYGNGGLSYGTEYEVVNYVELVDEYVEIVNNFGHNTEYLRKRFVSREEWREMMLNDLDI